MALIKSLSADGDFPLEEVGGKARNLALLMRGKFPVPDGFVVTTEAYRTYLTSHDVAAELDSLAGEAGSDARIRSLFEPAIPDELADQIRQAYAELTASGSSTVAVRSSATAEDLAEASFAGQQDSYLNVDGADAVLDAVRRCWASLWTERAVAYRREHQVHQPVALAVVVQRFVPADAAGVLFTANPTNGRRDETVLTAAYGLGESVVAGLVSPDTLVVRDGVVVAREIADKQTMTVAGTEGTDQVEVEAGRRRQPVLTDAQALALAALGGRIADYFGVPQDIEWTRVGDDLHIVQARPVTALPEPVGEVPTQWPVPDKRAMYVRGSIIEQLPNPLSPLFADLMRQPVGGSLRRMLLRYFDRELVRPGDIEFLTVNGFAYLYFSTPAMLRLLAASPLMLTTLANSRAELNGQRLWAEQAHPLYREQAERWNGVDAATLSMTELLAAARELLVDGADYYTAVQTVIPIAATAEIWFSRAYNATCKRRTDPPALSFLLGFDSAPIRAEKALYDLAQWCQERPAVAEALLARRPVPAPDAEAWEARLTAHLQRFGHTIYDLDFLSPVPADDPGPVLDAVRRYLGGQGQDPHLRQRDLSVAREQATAALYARLDPVRRRIIRPLLRRAQTVVPMREDALADIGLAWPALRRFLREAGRRLANAGMLDAPDQVFWLREAELVDAAARVDAGESALPSVVASIRERQRVWRGQRLASPPGLLPRGNLWDRTFQRWMPSRENQQAGPVLRGLGASTGRVSAPARVVRGPEDFADFQAGEVLVAPITTPAYTPLFAIAAAVVTDIGGPLSHSSIVAREYAIPAVLGTASATKRISTGTVITVDGAKGQVLLPETGAERPR